MGNRAALLTTLVLLGMAAPVWAGQNVWSGLVMAENTDKPHPAPPQIAPLEKTLVELFGYNQFEIIGESNKTLNTGQEDWLAASKYFALHVDARGENEAGYELDLKLFQDQQLLLETETKLSKASPLVIKGPQVGSGQLLLVLVVGEEQSDSKGDSQHHRRGHSRPSNPVVNAWRHLSRFVRGKGE